MNKYIFIFLFFMCISSGCKERYPPRYGVEFNPTREKLGITLLNEDWVYKIPARKEMTIWRSPKIDRSKPRHAYKKVYYRNGVLHTEVDNYENTQTFNTIDGTFKEYLDVIYYYIPKERITGSFKGQYVKETVSGWHCIYFHGDGENWSVRDVVTKAQADSIIASWGITD